MLKPQYAAVQFSKNTKQRTDEMFAEVLGSVSLAQRPERYVPLTQAKAQIQQRAQELSELNKFNTADKVSEILDKYPQANAWVPLKATAMDMVVLLNKEKGEVVKVADLRPWS